MAEVKRNVVNGVNTILMHGKNYVEVCERVRLVHDQKREFEVLESSPLILLDRCLWHVVIKVDGRLYTGNAEVKLNARPGTPDATNPFECGETSALGRALAFAGFGSVESIASFDEVYRATASDAQPQKASEKPATSESTNHSTENGKAMPASQGQAEGAKKPFRKGVVEVYRLGKDKQYWKSTGEFYAAISAMTGKAINESNVNGVSDETLADALVQPVGK